MKHKRILSLLVAVVMCAGFMPGYTLAATAETVGDLTIATANSSGYSYDSGSRLLTISGGGDYEISGSSSSDTIKVTAGDDVTITLDDVNIQSAGAPPLEIDAAGNVTIELKNENTLDASEGHSGYAGLQKTSTGNTLTITGSGELTATGGFGGGAGIGGAYHGDGSNIVIESGTIEATSSDGGAGIGAGAGYSYHNGASVTINGGTVTATGGSGAGIDSGFACGGNVTVTINGGAVTAKSSGGGAGIGGGVGDYGSVTVNINGGTVSATGDGGAGIGSGNGGSGSVTVNITGGTVNATDDGNGASLGSGKDNERNNNVNISGGYITLSKSSSDADYIGSGADSPDATDTVNITGGYFGDGSYSADTVYGCTVAEGYVVCANTNAGTSGAYPCYVSVSYEAAAKNSDGVYEIANTGQLFWFAALVNGDTTQEGINYSVPGADGILTADIDLGGAEWTPIGDYAASSIMYAGTFDGDGHIISGLYINSSSSYRGLFGYVETTGTVKNVTVYGSVTGNNYVGGIVGNNYGIVTNCTADVSVSGTYAGGIVGLNRGEVTYCFNSGAVGGSMYIGGVVGSTGSGAVVANCGNSGAVSGSGMNMNIGGVAGENVGTVTDCFNSGEVSGSTYVGGVIGFNMASASNCYSSGTVGGSWNVGGVVGYNYANGNSYNGSVTNCCYLENTADAAIGVDSGTTTDTFSKTSEEFASGEVAYLLNSGTTDGTQAWYQTLGTDDCPVLDSAHGAVYYTTICDGSSTFYSNSSVIHAGSYDENGFCTVCGGYQPATLNSDGIYEIANAGQLFWFAALIEGDTSHEGIFAANTDVSAVLTKSIDLSVTTIEWTPIGTKSAPYTGTFDGDGFEISELNITTAAEYIGLFGYVSTGTIKNLTVSGEIDVSGATIFAGGIVGTIRNGVLSNLTSNVDVTGKTADKGTFGGVAATVEGTDGTEGSTMELCVNNGKVTASGKLDCTGGLVGYMNSATIINSVNYGEVDTTGATAHQNAGVNTGGIVGYINNKTAYITNCVNIGKVSNAVSVTTGSNKMYCYTGAVVGRIRDDIGAITNVYYLNTGTNAAIGENEYGKEVDITAQTAEEFAKGAAAWLLQNANTDYVWGQDLGNDAFPLLTSDANKKVVKVSFYNFSGTTVLMESYTNMGGTVSSYPTDYTLYADSALTDVIGDIDTRAFYADTDIYAAEVRDLTITGTGIVEGTDYTYENNLLTVLTGGEYKISGTSTSDTIKVAASDDVTITLAGVDITNSSKPPMEIDCDSTVTVKLSGENTLESTGSDYAGLQLTNGNLTITSADDDGKTTGSLDAAGGIYAAGIGSGDSSDMSGNITINGGTVSGSSTYGAGIGSGDSANMNGSITINGSTASGTSSYGAGIGSGFWADMSGSITINGGTVSGTSLKSGAGIGSGRSEYDWDSNSGLNKLSGSITITGGTVFGTSAYSAGIGCGYYSNMTGSISISGGYVTAESDSGDNITATNTSIIGGYFADSSFTAGVGSEGAVYDCGIADGYVAYANIEDTNNVYYARVLSTGWTANVTYTAPFGASGTVPTDDKDYGYGAKVTVDDTLPLTKGSYGQTGWSLSDADTTSVTSFAISSDTILYPVFARQFTDTGVSTDISLTYGEAIAEIDLNDYLQFVDTSIDANGQFTFALADGSELPEGLELKNDVISGTPTAATTAAQSVSFTVTDNNPGYTLFAALEGNPATVSATLTLTFNVAKATPTYSVPSGITAVYGDTLATVTLPTGWTWDDENLSVGNIGTNEFAATFTPSDTANYETITENVSITVAPLPIEVEWDYTSFVYDGSEKTVTAKVVNAIGGDEVNPICIDNSATAVGSYEAAIMAVDNTNYTLTGGTGLTNEWTIEQSAADGSVKTYNGETETSAFTYGDTITVKAKFDATGTAASGFTLSSLALGTAAVFNGDTQISDAVTVTEGDEITLTVDSADLGAGDYTLTLKYCGDYNIAAMALDFDITIAKAEPTVTAPTGLTAVYGDTLKDVALPDADNGVWTWENAELSVGNVGDNKFTAIFTPTDSKYDTVTVEVTVTVEKAEPIYEVPTGLTAVYGDKLSDVALPNGWSWDDENMSVGEVGENEFAATYNPNDDNYNTVTANISVTVTKAEPAYEVPTGLTAVYGDSLASVTLPDGWTWEDESLNVGNAGTNAFTAIFTPGNDNYNTVTVEVSVTVEKAEPSYEVPTGLTAVYGDTLASVALPDNWTWADATASVDDAGGNTFAAIYTPEDVANYNTATEILTVTVEKAEQGVPSGFTVTQPDEETSTGTITGLTTDMEYSLDGGDTWEEITDDILTLDPGTVLIRYAETENYNAGAAVEITIDASNPSYTTPTDLTATYGDTLKDVELPTADNGIWTWENENQSVGNAGTNTFTVIFTPSDNNHNTVYVEVTVTVAKAMPTYEIPTGLTAVYGDILATVTLPTGWTWVDAAQSAGNAGTNTFTAIFTPSDSVNYETVTAEIDVEVGKAAPVYELPTGLTATYGDTLASVELPDGWAWTDDTQSVGDVGTNTFTAIYTPDDTENYNTVTAEITVTISAITLTVTEAPTAARVKRNNTLSKSTLSSGSVALADGTEISGTWAWADGMETMSKSGTYERTAVFTADDESYGTVKATVTVTVYTSGGGGSSSGTVTYTVTAEDAENGGVNVSSTSAKSGASVTITVTPNDGYEAESITAADASGNEIELTQTDDDTYTFIMPSSDVSISAAFKKIATEENDSGEDEEDTHICQSEKFTDVNTSLWYHEYIDYVLENGLMNGTGGTTFEPDTATTRAMIVTILYRLEGEPKVNTAAAFTDVAAGDWYADAVAWAAENGIVLGYGDETFGANDVITREQTAAILYRYANYKSTDTSVGEDTNILSYTDADEISEYAIPAMQWAVGTGLVNGKGNNTLDPQGGATRAETAAMLMRFIEAE